MEENNNTKPTECTGNCQFEEYMLLTICTTCGADDWGTYPEPELENNQITVVNLNQ